ncbi:MAG: hypothetical protein P8J02_01040 [Yoonia sp.]|nr:hypothetical protein [Yoonia sp.]
MRQLRHDTHLILDGEVRMYRRELKQALAGILCDNYSGVTPRPNTLTQARARVT